MKFWNGEIPDHLVKVGSVVSRVKEKLKDYNGKPPLGHIVRFRENAFQEIILEVQWSNEECPSSIHPANIAFLIEE